jgi:hypothetical protein
MWNSPPSIVRGGLRNRYSGRVEPFTELPTPYGTAGRRQQDYSTVRFVGTVRSTVHTHRQAEKGSSQIPRQDGPHHHHSSACTLVQGPDRDRTGYRAMDAPPRILIDCRRERAVPTPSVIGPSKGEEGNLSAPALPTLRKWRGGRSKCAIRLVPPGRGYAHHLNQANSGVRQASH